MYGFVGACHKQLSYGDFQLTSNLKTTRSISHGSEYCLCIGVEAYFYGVGGITQEFVSGTFRSVNSNSAHRPNTSSR